MVGSARHALLVVDLGYGDAGKGSVVDYLTRQHRAHTVVRFNGGAQAAHNVVTSEHHHTFAQFGSGMLVPGVQTYLSRHMLVEPYAMFNEADHLEAIGVSDPFARTWLDMQALIITPYHIAANRLKELARGDNRHGSCGMGIGETMADATTQPDLVLHAGDLMDWARVSKKLRAVRDAKYAEIEPLLRDLPHDKAVQQAREVFDVADIVGAAADNYAVLARMLNMTDEAEARRIFDQPGVMVFEGAQGVLLDEWYGFAPYTTWSTTTFANALGLLRAFDYGGDVTRLGVLRAYMTRHGAGPFVTESADLTARLPDAHNVTSPWQQSFRVGHFDAVAARYALDATEGADALVITNLDRLMTLSSWQFCDAYQLSAPAPDSMFEQEGTRIRGIRVQRPPDLAHQAELTHWLQRCTPEYRSLPGEVRNLERYLSWIAHTLGLPIAITSHGPAAADKRQRFALA